MKRRRGIAMVFWLTCFVAGSHGAFAQDRQPLRLGAGYQFLHESVEGGGETFPIGGYLDIEHVVKADQMKSWGWMGQFEANFRSDSGFSEQLYTVLGGVRLASTKQLRWVPSGFGLIGLGTLNASCTQFCIGTNSGFALQGGFALSTRMNESTLVDIAFKATKLKEGGGLFNAAVAAGFRFDLGGR